MADETLTTEPTTTEPTSPLTDWRASLPEEIRADKSLESFKDVGTLAKSYIETKKMVGQRQEGLLKVPGPNATPEETAAFHRALGAPEAPDKYQITRPDVALKGVWDEQAERDFLGLAHKHGANPKFVQDIINFYGRFEAQKLHQTQQEASQVEAKLRQEWGSSYDARVGRTNRLIGKYAGGEFDDFLGRTGLGRHPMMVQFLDKIAQEMDEAELLSDAAGSGYGTTPEEAQERIDQIQNDPKHPYNVPGHPQWEQARDEVLALRRIVLGKENRTLVEYR